MLTGLNHLTLAVRDVARSAAFYSDLLGFRLHAQWDAGAYLALGDLWLCISLDTSVGNAARPARDYTHYAFSIAQQDFAPFREHLQNHGVPAWKENRSEGDSWYFLDPDGHQLEIHVGSLASRLAQCRRQPYAGMKFYGTD